MSGSRSPASSPWRQRDHVLRARRVQGGAPAGGKRARAVLAWALAAAAVFLLARGLPTRTFFVGDPGLKLIAARNAIAHPSRPLEIDLPRAGSQPLEPLDPSFRIHDGHAHAATSELFPLLSAPLVAAFGIGGAYILPALGLLLAVWATAAVGVELDGRRSRAALIFAGAACTPLVFYGLEFWEHAPSVGLAALATLLVVRRPTVAAGLGCGLLLGMAMLLRPEALWYGVALAIASRRHHQRPPLAQVVALGAGVAVAYLPLLIFNFLHYGHALGGHVARNMAELGENWWWDRALTLRLWFVPPHGAWLAGCLVLAAAALLVGRRHPAARRAVHVAGLLFVAVAAAAATRRVFEPASLWNAAPAVLLVVTTPFPGLRRGQGFAAAVALVYTVLVTLTAPNDGGGQWGPRYLLLAFVPATILVADAAAAGWKTHRVLGAVAVVVIAAASLLVARNAYRELQGAKRTYGRLLDAVESRTPPSSYIVTDLWWLQQVTAAMYPGRVVLFLDRPKAARTLYHALAGKAVVAVTSADGGASNGALESWCREAGFTTLHRTDVPERRLTIVQLLKS